MGRNRLTDLESRSADVSVLDGAEEGDVGQKRRTALVAGRDVEVVGALDLVFQHLWYRRYG